MKKIILGKQSVALTLVITALAVMISGCGQADAKEIEGSNASTATTVTINEVQISNNITEGEEENSPSGIIALEVRFGDRGESFILTLDDNETAAAIAGYVGTADWRLPIYHYNDYENWEVMQFYDIPSHYEIPSNAKTVTSQKAGEVYYSEPNRIILFYQDSEITGEYTKIGSIADSAEFREAVENNPVLEGWGNKIVLINSME